METDERVSMLMDAPTHSDPSPAASKWSNRILFLALAGILFLTLYPFQFDFHKHLARPLFPFSLNSWGKEAGRFDDFLNILLFVPFGFGLAEKLRDRGKSKLAVLGFALATGALLSYTIEILQIYTPDRDSGWEDVLTNSFGAFVGATLFALCGEATLRLLSATEHQIGAWLTWRRAAVIVLLYIGGWCAVTVPLQDEARPSNWNSNSLVVIGNSTSIRFSRPWQGRVFALELWNHAVSADGAASLTSHRPLDVPIPDSIVAYRLSGSAPFQDERHLLPDISWTPRAPDSSNSNDPFLDGKSWLTTPTPTSALVSAFNKTGQFALRIVCRPAEVTGMRASIISITSPFEAADMDLRQQDASLVFWFRTPLTIERPRMSWVVPQVFAANETRDILLSFDGANLRLFIDGKRYADTYELGAGAALARLIRHIKPLELGGYQFIFCALILFPAGCLVGLASRTITAPWSVKLSLVLSGLVLPSLTLESVLVHVSGRAVSFENILLSILLGASGSIWINADRVRRSVA